jgi:2-polyprenyl-3-methyl-5-hydroxy-6-metoxy-1,4-benzoquinol methylase
LPESSSARNLDYYGDLRRGRDDYWRKMAAPRFRVATFLECLRVGPTSRLVDLGCGNGSLLEELRRDHPALPLTGIDFSATQIAVNAARAPSIHWHVVDLDHPEAVPGELRDRFDHVVASEIIEHLSQPLAFLQNARALASAPSGRLLLSTQSGPIRETERRVGHVRHFGRSDLTALLGASDWQPERVWNSGFPFHDLSKWWANRDPDATMARFGERPYGLAEDLVCWLLRLLFRLNSRRRGAQLFAVARVPSSA